MATSLTNIQLSAAIRATLSDTIESVTRSAQGSGSASLSFTNGTAINQADVFYQDLGRTISSGNNEDLNLFSMAGFDTTKDALNNVAFFENVCGMLVVNTSSSAGDLIIGNNATTAAWVGLLQADTDEILLPADGFLCCGTRDATGWAVANTTSHLLRMTASGGNVTYDITLLGRSS